MFIITKVSNKLIIRRTFRRDKSCDVFIFFARDAFFDLSHFESIWIKWCLYNKKKIDGSPQIWNFLFRVQHSRVGAVNEKGNYLRTSI